MLGDKVLCPALLSWRFTVVAAVGFRTSFAGEPRPMAIRVRSRFKVKLRAMQAVQTSFGAQ